WCLHVVGKPTKRAVAPAAIERIGLCAAQSSECLHVPVADAPVAQCLAQRFAIELRIVPGARHRAYIDQTIDAVSSQYLNQLVERARRVSDGENDSRPFHVALCLRSLSDRCIVGLKTIL